VRDVGPVAVFVHLGFIALVQGDLAVLGLQLD